MHNLKLFFSLAASVLLISCTQVQPWERNQLALDAMQWSKDTQHEALSNHIYSSKESSSGGNSAAGGGWGCKLSTVFDPRAGGFLKIPGPII